MSSRRVVFTPGKPPRALVEPTRDRFLKTPKPDFIPPVPVVTRSGSGPKRVWSRGLKRLLALAILFIAMAGILTGVAILDIVQGAALTRTAVLAAQDASVRLDLPVARTALSDAHVGLVRMDRGFRRLSYLHILPAIGDQVEAGARATSAAMYTTGVLVDSFQVAEEVFASVDGFSDVLTTNSYDIRPYADLSPLEKERLLRAISSVSGDLRSMEVRLRLAQEDLERLDALPAHPVIIEAIAPLEAMLPSLVAAVDILQPVAQIIPEFGGLNEDKQFLVLYLDNATLRPGGGVLVASGQLLVRDGEVVSLQAGDTRELDNLARVSGYATNVPQPLAQYANVSSWLATDAAWSVHMPETARIATALLRQEMAHLGVVPPQVDGVIAVTPEFVERVFLLVGSVQIEGVTYTQKNAAELVALSTQDTATLQALLLSLTQKTLALPPSRWPDIFTLLHEAFAQKQIAVISNEESVQDVLTANALSGSIEALPVQDALLLVDANVSGALDSRIDRTIDYSFVKHEGGYRATTRVTYEHTGDAGSERYRDYAQLYVPLGAQLVSASGFLAGDSVQNPQGLAAPVVIGEDLGFSTFSGFFALEPGESHVLTFVYDLPSEVIAAISRGDYQLVVFKQMGSGETLLTLNLDFGTTVATATPGEVAAEYFNTSYVVDAVLTQDQHFRVRLNR